MYYLSDFCLICLSANGLNNLIPIDKKNKLYQHIKFIFPEITNLDPDCLLCICCTCQTAFQYFYKFKKMFMNSYFHLKNYTDTLQKASTFQDKSFTELRVIIKREGEKENIGLENTKVTEKSSSLRDQEAQENLLNKAISEKAIAPEDVVNLNFVEEFVPILSNKSVEDMSYVTVDLNSSNINAEKINFECLVCGKTFSNKIQLNKHKKSHLIFKCEYCDKIFNKSYLLKTHKKIHAGVKDYECTLCNKKFLLKSYLSSHMKIHSGIKLHECQICNKKFSQSKYLRCHMKMHTGVKDLECTLCPKTFSKSSQLKMHLKVHSGIKDYECSVCKKKFGQNSHLKRHLQTHFKEREFVCLICNKKFTSSFRLNIHNKRHTAYREVQDVM